MVDRGIKEKRDGGRRTGSMPFQTANGVTPRALKAETSPDEQSDAHHPERVRLLLVTLHDRYM